MAEALSAEELEFPNKDKEPIRFAPTSRGFLLGTFFDHHGLECRIQKSSLATENCIWLGQVYGIYVHGDCLPRMHLTRERAGELAEILQHFADTGELPSGGCQSHSHRV